MREKINLKKWMLCFSVGFVSYNFVMAQNFNSKTTLLIQAPNPKTPIAQEIERLRSSGSLDAQGNYIYDHSLSGLSNNSISLGQNEFTENSSTSNLNADERYKLDNQIKNQNNPQKLLSRDWNKIPRIYSLGDYHDNALKVSYSQNLSIKSLPSSNSNSDRNSNSAQFSELSLPPIVDFKEGLPKIETSFKDATSELSNYQEAIDLRLRAEQDEIDLYRQGKIQNPENTINASSAFSNSYEKLMKVNNGTHNINREAIKENLSSPELMMQYSLDRQIESSFIDVKQANKTITTYIQKKYSGYFLPQTIPSTDDMELYSQIDEEQEKLSQHIQYKYRLSYPKARKIVNEVYEIANIYELEPKLVLALIAIESGFNQNAVSVAGAIGLTQAIEKWHPEKFERVENNGYQSTSIEGNLEIGAEVLKEYLDKYNGNKTLALQQYNGSLDDQTRKYSKKVLGMEKELIRVADRLN